MLVGECLKESFAGEKRSWYVFGRQGHGKLFVLREKIRNYQLIFFAVNCASAVKKVAAGPNEFGSLL